MIIEANKLLLPGVQVLWKDGNVVWFGKLGEPIEDVDCDKISVSPADYERVKAATIESILDDHDDG